MIDDDVDIEGAPSRSGVGLGVVLVGVGALAALLAAAGAFLRRPGAFGEPAGAVDMSPAKSARHKSERQVMRDAAAAILKRPPTLAEILYLHAIADLESSYGRGWKGAMVGSNNYGAVQCSASQARSAGVSVAGIPPWRAGGAIGAALGGLPQERRLVTGLVTQHALHAAAERGDLVVSERVELGAAGGSVRCVLYEDSRADGSKYSVSFRAYDTPLDGATDLARHVFGLRPSVADALSSPQATCFRASFAMRREKYYEGFCPAATKAHGATNVRKSLGNPDADAATKACEQEAVTAHAKRAYQLVSEAAFAAGDARRIPLGTFEDAKTWWTKRRAAAGAGK
ncbi:hypothetical protein [Chondromyces apiculatus]|uniref:Uncharacterized protein n=1 Tax=Chondromyces apiculatus DSM 436 TaxID=1192034 RepID=A0A017TE33_9BACT|nr:hypothetical protein [Chondromyces apiculatus]EYF07055.1 Hypothetical protein CAP_1314 [Chondromyces apiculatus DSM 436]